VEFSVFYGSEKGKLYILNKLYFKRNSYKYLIK
jgi:hypothetical protein